MTATPRSASVRRLRVLFIGIPGAASMALSIWLGERGWLDVAGPAPTTIAALVLADRFKPDVVLLDFHGLPISLGCTVSLLKELSPVPLVLVLSHETSTAMRRRCREAGVDAVFDKTTELEAVAAQLEQAEEYLAESPAHRLRDAALAKPTRDSQTTAS